MIKLKMFYINVVLPLNP